VEATLQVIIEQLKELSTGQSALKSEISTITTELKSDMCRCKVYHEQNKS
jgi:hypothetical protein